MRLRLTVISAIIACASACALHAQQAIFELDPLHTTVTFELGDVLHTVHGTFKAKSGKAEFDTASGEASGSFVVDVTTGESGNHVRDRKMHKDILESEKFPEASFTPKHVTGAIKPDGQSTIEVQGIFRLHGADHEITLSVPVEVEGNDLTAKLHFAIPYVDWGLKDPSNLVLRVGKRVEIDIAAHGSYMPQQR